MVEGLCHSGRVKRIRNFQSAYAERNRAHVQIPFKELDALIDRAFIDSGYFEGGRPILDAIETFNELVLARMAEYPAR